MMNKYDIKITAMKERTTMYFVPDRYRTGTGTGTGDRW